MKINSRKIVSYTVTLPSTWLQMLVRAVNVVWWDGASSVASYGCPRCEGGCPVEWKVGTRAETIMGKRTTFPQMPTLREWLVPFF